MHPEGTPRLELRFRRGEIIRDNGFEGNLWFALETTNKLDKNRVQIYISALGRIEKIYRYISDMKLNLLKR